ncbi:hypothetical protein [Deinococcus navajonensis]|uniref:Uncharacterized protein n=1 Tax=Deinococcus navajonensis TaxID=309884 RepID=A0ABV8XTB7_9DEIO
MNRKATVLTMLLTFVGVATAQTTVTLPGTVPASVTQSAQSALQTFLASGGTLSVLDASGAVIGTVNANGTLTLAAGKTLSDVRSVRVAPAQGTAQTYTFSRSLDKSGAIKIEWMQPNGKMASLPLSAIVNRMSNPTPTTSDDAQKGKKQNDQKENKGKGNSKK